MACVPQSVEVRERVRDRARRAAVWAALTFSALTGLALMCVLVTPQRLMLIRTPELLGMLALLVLPGATLWAFRRSQEPASHGASGATKSSGEAHRAPVREAVAVQSGVRVRPRQVAQAAADNWQIVIPVEMYSRAGGRSVPLAKDTRGAAHAAHAAATHRTGNRRRVSRGGAEHRTRSGAAETAGVAMESTNGATGLPNRAA